jgi:pilus assembly protein CpaE
MKALMISRDSLLHAEIAAQGSARLPAVQLVADRARACALPSTGAAEAPELVIFDASDVEPGEGNWSTAWRATTRTPASSC